jgi:DNA-binding transcriptional regulator YiaG
MKELWKDVVGYEGIYIVSSLGNIKNIKTGRDISLCTNLGYARISLSKNGNIINRTVHSLVMESFVGVRHKNFVINHIDGNKSNNTIYNLEYCSQSYNRKEDFRTGRQSFKGEKNNKSKLTELKVLEIVELRKQKKISYRALATLYNVHFTGISNIFNGHTWSELTNITKKW